MVDIVPGSGTKGSKGRRFSLGVLKDLVVLILQVVGQDGLANLGVLRDELVECLRRQDTNRALGHGCRSYDGSSLRHGA